LLVSLPCHRFGRPFACKILVREDFSARPRSEKIFTLSFPERQGKGGRRYPAVVHPFGVAAVGSGIVASFLRGSPATGKERRDLAPVEHADEP
jgi:hypothetical protein